MKTRKPTSKEIAELAAFLPRLYAEGLTPIKRWGGGSEDEDGVFTMPWPEYDEVVKEFFRLASKECWTDYNYPLEDAIGMIRNEDFVKSADLDQIKTMLTFCVRGERFADGHWGRMIECGNIRRLLQRLAELELDNA